MLYHKDADELSLISTAILLYLLQRLVDEKVLRREAALAILGDAADSLIANPLEAMDVHHKASDLIRREIAPRV